jgi:predicted SAM-dependent methyltransferase
VKLNLGCGVDLKKGYVNVDMYGSPDLVLDLREEWPWPDSSVEEVEMMHVLEHLPDTISVMKKLYRVCADGAKVHIVVPHPRHDDYLSDPTHVSPVTNRTLKLFSKKICEERKGFPDTPLAEIHGVDFEMVEESMSVEPKWLEKLQRGEITDPQLREYCMLYSNVIKECDVTLKVHK